MGRRYEYLGEMGSVEQMGTPRCKIYCDISVSLSCSGYKKRTLTPPTGTISLGAGKSTKLRPYTNKNSANVISDNKQP